MDLARPEVEVDLVVREDAGELLDDAPQLDGEGRGLGIGRLGIGRHVR
jgi:hypothetical protein